MIQKRSLALCVFGMLAMREVPLHAQQFTEFGAGWNAVATSHPADETLYKSGPFLRGSIGQTLAPRLRLRFDLDAMFFRYETQLSRPCPSPGCPFPEYIEHDRAVGGVTANVLVSFDHRETAYLFGGAGVYDANAAGNALAAGVSLGAGAALSGGPHPRAFVEASWHGLAPDPGINGPRWLAPVAVAIRF